MSEKLIIGIGGKKRHGKDTAYKILNKHFNFKQYAFADEIKLWCEILNPILGFDGLIRLNDLLKFYTWDQIKSFAGDEDDRYKEASEELRRLQQIIGTEIVRERVDTNFWVKKVFEQIKEDDYKSKRFAITDVRFPNELKSIKDEGGYTIYIKRKVKDNDKHASETSVNESDFDEVVENYGTLEELEEKILKIGAKLCQI